MYFMHAGGQESMAAGFSPDLIKIKGFSFKQVNECQKGSEELLLLTLGNWHHCVFFIDDVIVYIIIIIVIIIIVALPRRHFHRVALHPYGGPTAFCPCPRTVWQKIT